MALAVGLADFKSLGAAEALALGEASCGIMRISRRKPEMTRT